MCNSSKKLNVNTQLDSFLFIHSILEFDNNHIVVYINCIDKSYGTLILEATAQTASMHIKCLNHFEKHSFLLSVKGYDYSILDPKNLNLQEKRLKCIATIVAESDTSYQYSVSIPELKTEFILNFSTVKFDHEFDKSALQNYYSTLFKCLINV